MTRWRKEGLYTNIQFHDNMATIKGMRDHTLASGHGMAGYFGVSRWDWDNFDAPAKLRFAYRTILKVIVAKLKEMSCYLTQIEAYDRHPSSTAGPQSPLRSCHAHVADAGCS